MSARPQIGSYCSPADGGDFRYERETRQIRVAVKPAFTAASALGYSPSSVRCLASTRRLMHCRSRMGLMFEHLAGFGHTPPAG